MSPPDSAPSQAPPDESDLSRSYAAVIVIEILVLAGLYWLGRHFG